MAASLLLNVGELVGISALQVPHPDTGSPTSVLVTATSREDRMTLAGRPAEVRAALRTALAALDAADPALGDQADYHVSWPPAAPVQEVAS
jgi:hypothetical protein